MEILCLQDISIPTNFDQNRSRKECAIKILIMKNLCLHDVDILEKF